MAAKYPTALVTATELPTNRTDSTVMLGAHAAEHDQLAMEIIAIEAELGLTPKGSSASVRARLDAIAAALATIQTKPVYTVTNNVTDRVIDVNSTTINELLHIVGTLISDLKTANILG